MAHLYDNFDAAYAALCSDWQTNQDLHIEGRGWADDAYNEGNSPVLLYEFQALCLSVMNMYNLVWNLFDIRESAPDQSDLYESIYWANKDVPSGDDYDLTLIKIREAYTHAHDDHRAGLLMIMDAYRASMYDKPFDKEYHALWIQRFRSWQ